MIYTFSKFYYGYKVTSQPYNGYIDIDEGAGEISIQVPTGSYSLDDFKAALRDALLSQGTLEYSVDLDRSTRIFTISATDPFDILTSTGSHAGSSIYDLIGFDNTADYTGGSSYDSIKASGKCYYPQFKLQSYIPPEDWQEKHEAAVNVASTGTVVEVVSFGLAKFIQMDIKFITNLPSDGQVVRSNSRGVEDARDFLQFITDKNYFEFMPNEVDSNTRYKVILESNSDYSDGTGYKLKELYDKNLPGIYETDVMKLRVVE